MMDEKDIREGLAGFTGSETFWRYSPLFPNVVITEGVQFLAENAGAYWLLDLVASHLPTVQKADESFAVVLLERNEEGSGAVVRITDDVPENVKYAEQEIEYTDFPLPSIKLYAGFDGENWTILLPNEY